MRYKFSVKTDCFACLGIITEFIKKIPGVSSAELDSKNEEIIIDYEGELNREDLKKVLKEKTGYEFNDK